MHRLDWKSVEFFLCLRWIPGELSANVGVENLEGSRDENTNNTNQKRNNPSAKKRNKTTTKKQTKVIRYEDCCEMIRTCTQ